MSDISRLTERLVAFNEQRNWKQFHNPKDLALSLVLEAAEVMEHFQWKSVEEMKAHVSEHRSAIGEELADVLYWVLLMSYYFEIDIANALEEKMVKNDEKYPVEKAKGRHEKYNQL